MTEMNNEFIIIIIIIIVALVAWISLTLSRHSSLSFIAISRSSGQHPVSSHSCWMYVRADRPAFARPCVGVHKRSFSSKYKLCWKNIMIEAVFTKSEINNDWNIHFLQNCPLGTQSIYSSEFSTFETANLMRSEATPSILFQRLVHLYILFL